MGPGDGAGPTRRRRGGHRALPRDLRAGAGRQEGDVERAVLPGDLRGGTRALRRGARAVRARRALLEEVALTVWLAGPLAQVAGWVELLAGDPAAAEAELAARVRHADRDRRGDLAVDRRRDPRRGDLRAGPLRRGRGASPRSARSRRERGRLLAACSGAASGPSASPRQGKTPRRSTSRRERRRTQRVQRRARPPLARADEPGRGPAPRRTADDADAALRQATQVAEEKGNLVAARLSREALAPA